MIQLMRPARGHNGFSILDVLSTVAVFGILLGIAMPQIQRVRLMTELSSGQQAAASALLRARWLAINRGRQHTVTLNGSNVLQLHDGDASATVVSSANLSNYGVSVDSFPAVSFDARGFLPTSATITLRQSQLPATKTVTIGVYGKVVAP